MARALTEAARFQNREFEFRVAHQKQAGVTLNKPHALLFWSRKSYGSTAFLNELQRKNKSFHTAYFDCRERSVDGFLRDFILSLYDTSPKLHRSVINSLEKLGETTKAKAFFDFVISYIPYVGELLLKLSKPRKSGIGNAYKVNFSPNQILSEVAKHLAEREVTLLLSTIFEDNFPWKN